MAYPLSKRILTPIAKLWLKEINGIQNLPKDKPFIIAANHASYMDHLIIGVAVVNYLNKKLYFLAKKEHFDTPLKKAWHMHFGAIPLDRERGGKKALRWAVKALKEGKIIVIHPEGTRTLTGRLQRAKTGVARLALAAKVPVVPVGLIGTFEILPKGKHIPKLKKATMNIGKPIHFNKYHGKNINKKMLREATRSIMNEIARLCNQRYNLK
ncbi:1-acyl-sn-glycerol-3-phosphate acyltransferase [Candidatus Woesearchaeota archaeon]|nr:1-acyl-sn-glycerol-3-phosphate acyltransferase [Candidatus Woesearchaeota archaeon]